MRGAVSTEPSAQPAVTPRHSPNFRPPRRTRRSVAPATRRVSDRTVVRSARTRRLRSSRRIGSREGGEGCGRRLLCVPGSTRRPRPPKQSGLIAREKNTKQSAKTRFALDNRLHRTDLRFCCAAKMVTASEARDPRRLPQQRESLVMPRTIDSLHPACRWDGLVPLGGTGGGRWRSLSANTAVRAE